MATPPHEALPVRGIAWAREAGTSAHQAFRTLGPGLPHADPQPAGPLPSHGWHRDLRKHEQRPLLPRRARTRVARSSYTSEIPQVPLVTTSKMSAGSI
jgi:hypothetical protein